MHLIMGRDALSATLPVSWCWPVSGPAIRPVSGRCRQLMSLQTMAANPSIVSMPYCSVGFPVVSTAIR